jgi:hypothetical protein
MEHRARRRPHDIAPFTVCTFAPFWQQVYVCFPSPSTAIWIRFLISALAGGLACCGTKECVWCGAQDMRWVGASCVSLAHRHCTNLNYRVCHGDDS